MCSDLPFKVLDSILVQLRSRVYRANPTSENRKGLGDVFALWVVPRDIYVRYTYNYGWNTLTG